MAQQFAEETERVSGVVEVAIVGSAATATLEPGDLDLAVFIDDRGAIPAVARAARRLTSTSHRWAVWVFEAEERAFIGWVGVRKREPLIVDPDFEFDERKLLNVDPKVLWSRAGEIMTIWRREAVEKAELVGWPLPQPLTDRPLRCLDCGEQWIWASHEQRVFRDRGWKAPVRCHQCRPYRCGICGKKTAISRRDADARDLFACEFCAMELQGIADDDDFEPVGLSGAPIRLADFGDDLDVL